MSNESQSGDLHGTRFINADLSKASFIGCDLSGVIMRGVDIAGADIDAPWLIESGDSVLLVNGIDVAPYVDRQLDERFPGRSTRRATDPEGLQIAWGALERTWAETVARVQTMPQGVVDVSVRGEWSFAQTLRHLIMATDTWLGKAILGNPQPYHRVGQPNAEFAADGGDMSVFAGVPPSFTEVLAVRADRVAMVRDFIATTTTELLAEQRPNPHNPSYGETVLSCLRTILEEEWEHHRYAVRDLALIP